MLDFQLEKYDGTTGQFSYSPIERVFVEESDQIDVKPVPSTGLVTISAGKSVETDQVVVYNSYGKEVYPTVTKVTSKELSVDFTNLARGALFIKITTNNGTTNLRVLIAK